MSLCMVSVIIEITMNYHCLGSSTALHWHGLESWRHAYFQKTSVFSDSTTATHRSTGGEILHEWMCYLKMQRSLVLCEEAHFRTGKWVHNILWKPLEVWVSLASLQKLPCLHSSHSALVTICERHFKADFSKPGSARAFQTLLLTPQLSRICCYFKKLHVPKKSSVDLLRVWSSASVLKCLQQYLDSLGTCKGWLPFLHFKFSHTDIRVYSWLWVVQRELWSKPPRW